MSPSASWGGSSVKAQVAIDSPATMAGRTSACCSLVARAGQRGGHDVAREQRAGRDVRAERVGDEGEVGRPVPADAAAAELLGDEQRRPAELGALAPVVGLEAGVVRPAARAPWASGTRSRGTSAWCRGRTPGRRSARAPSRPLLVSVGGAKGQPAILASSWASRNFSGRGRPRQPGLRGSVPPPWGSCHETRTRPLGSCTRWLTDVAGLDDVCVDHLEIPAAPASPTRPSSSTPPGHDDAGTPTVHRLVARIAPQAYTVFLEANFETQFRVMEALGEHTDVPVPDDALVRGRPGVVRQPVLDHGARRRQAPSDAPHYSDGGWLHDVGPDAAGAGLVERHRGAGRGAQPRLARARARLPRRPRARRARARAAAHLLRRVARLGGGGRGRSTAPGRPRRARVAARAPTRVASRAGRRSRGATRGSATRCTATARWSRCSTGRWSRWATRASTSAGGCSATRCSRPARAGRVFPGSRRARRRWRGGRSSPAAAATTCTGSSCSPALRFTVVMLRLGTLLHDDGLIPEPFGYDNAISQRARRPARRRLSVERSGRDRRCGPTGSAAT